MKAIEILVEEHDYILSMIEVSKVILADHNSTDLPLDDVKFLVDFIQNFADKYHHMKEEDILFTEMGNYGMPAQNSPVGVMLSEHNQGRAYIKLVKEGISNFEAGDTSAYIQIKENLLSFGELLTQHIFKENNILYPMSETLIPESAFDEMSINFEMSNSSTPNDEYYEIYIKKAKEFSAKYLG